MNENKWSIGKIGIGAAIILVVIALGLYLYSERAVPPEPGPASSELLSESTETDNGDYDGDGGALDAVPSTESAESAEPAPASPIDAEVVSALDEPPEPSPPAEIVELAERVQIARADRELRADLGSYLGPEQMDRFVEQRLIERAVITINSLDGDPIPLRFRPLDHVPGLPRVADENDHWRLPKTPDPRYQPYRAIFDQFGAETLVTLFERFEPAMEQAWRDLGDQRRSTFRARVIEVIDHLATFELPEQPPVLKRPEVLYEFADPTLEQLSWGRKILIRIGPEHASTVKRKLKEVRERLEETSPY